MSGFSSILKITDLDDFINPSQVSKQSSITVLCTNVRWKLKVDFLK